MLLLALLALVVGMLLAVKAPPPLRRLAVPIVAAVSLGLLSTPLMGDLLPEPVAAVAVVAFAASLVATIAGLDLRYLLTFIVPVPMRSTYRTDGARFRDTWTQWRGRVMRHRSVALTG